MKLRIKGNSIRMRLSQQEVDELASSGKISEAISFGRGKLTYQLSTAQESKMSAIYDNDIIQINIPKSDGLTWASSDQVGIEGKVPLRDENALSVLIEKDFKCLTDRSGEDESDLYENPQSQHNC